jgi:hypothetical protein
MVAGASPLLLNASLGLGLAQGVAGLFKSSGKYSLYQNGKKFDQELMQSKRLSEHQLYMNKRSARELPGHIRAGAEAAGINPLLMMGGGTPGVNAGYPMSAPIMSGNRMSEMAVLSDTLLGVEELRLRKAELEMQKEDLEKKTQDLTLKEPDGGIYQRTQTSRANTALEQSEAEDITQTYVTDGGAEIDVQVGPDPDELLSGQILDYFADRKRVRELTDHNRKGLGSWRNEMSTGPSRRSRAGSKPYLKPPYKPGKNPPLRGYYGRPGSRTGF